MQRANASTPSLPWLQDCFEEFAGRLWTFIYSILKRLNVQSRTQLLRDGLGIGLCNITKCCTEVCPEEIHITDNAIIPLKERVVDEFYDPVLMLVRKIRGAKRESS